MSSSNSGSDCIRVLVADDHPAVREGIAAAIKGEIDMRVVAEAQDGREAVEKALSTAPDVCLLDLRMPRMDGIEATIAILQQRPKIRIAILSSYDTQEDVYKAIQRGAHGYISKEASVTEIIASIRAINAGKTWIPPRVGAKLAQRLSDRSLTRREREVLRTMAVGKSNKEIGVAFDISEATVKVHVTHILEKLKVTSRTEAISVAVKRGLVHLD
jgi:two-component system, NarL family, response regulator